MRRITWSNPESRIKSSAPSGSFFRDTLRLGPKNPDHPPLFTGRTLILTQHAKSERLLGRFGGNFVPIKLSLSEQLSINFIAPMGNLD
jgi:hypothetical protein